MALKRITKALIHASIANRELRPSTRKLEAMSLRANRKIFDKGAGSPKKVKKLKRNLTKEHLGNALVSGRYNHMI